MSEAISGTGFRTYRTRMSLRSCGLRLTGEIDFENLNKGFDDLDDGVGVRQILNCGL